MDRIDLKVHVPTGHYTQPGVMGVMGVVRTYPMAPPSTMTGFVESLCGKPVGAFKATESEMAYGWALDGRPKGFATLLQRMHVVANQTDAFAKEHKITEGVRPYHRECLFYMIYRVTVKGPFAELIRKALVGDVERTGVLSLGDSDDMVDWISESVEPAEWLIPGQTMALPICTPGTYANVQAIRGRFDLSASMVNVPDTAWMTPGGTP